MKTIIPLLIFCFLISGCRNEESQHVLNSLADSLDDMDTTRFPLLIDGGTKIVYQVGHLTPDKGLKLYYDTIAYPEGGLIIDQSVRRRLLAQ